MAAACYMITRSFNSWERTAELAAVRMRFLFPVGILLQAQGRLKPCWLANKNNLPTPQPTRST